MKKINIFMLLIVTASYTVIISGCSSGGYGSRNYIKHTYTTDTQRGGHALSGVDVNYKLDTGQSFIGVLAQGMFLTKLDITFYINKEEIETFNTAAGYNTFIKLPPGEHEFAYRVNMQGVLTAGIPTDKTFYVFKFTIPPGEVSQITLHPTFSNKEERELDIDFDNVSRYRMIGKCYNDYYKCNPS